MSQVPECTWFPEVEVGPDEAQVMSRNFSCTLLRLHDTCATCIYLETLWEGESRKSSDFPVSNCGILISFESMSLLEIADL